MSEIDIVIPQDANPIEITTPTATEETEVQAEETQNNTSYNVGGDAYYTDLAKDWAIKMNGKVLGQDYSSKYYAYLAQQIEGQVAQDTEDAQIWAEGTDAQVQALGGEHSSKGWVNYVLTNPPEAYVTQTQTGCLLTVTDINGTTTAELLNGQDGQDGAPGADGTDGTDGADGVGISSINKTSTSGLVDTYTITLSDSNTYNFTVTNGQNGAKGDKGDKGDTGNTGATGPTGNGIASIAKTSTSGLVDTYTITYTNADTDNFTVTNGQNGTNGTNGTDGQDGADGFSPIATVTKSGDTATISITDKNGTTTATISDGQDQPELTFSTGLTDTNNIITVTDYAKLIKNTATGTNSLTLLGTATGEGISINIGSSSKALGEGCVAIGADSSAGASGKDGSIAIGSGNTTSSGRFSIAMGYYAVSSADEAIQIGYGTNSTANSLNIGFYNNSTTHYNWQLLDGATGLIPDARLSTNIARTVDIPTQASDINALPDSTKYGKSIDLSLNTTDYKLTLTLKDQDGTTLNTKTVDFPIESVVVGGSYDSTNKKIVLTLQNGNTIDVPVGDLVAGLQTEITSSNKLSADLVDDTSTTHKFATSSQLTQIATNTGNISSINSIIGGYGDIVTHNVSEFADSVQGGKADTALQPNDNISKLVNDSGYITGITSSDVTTALGYTPYNSSNPNGYTSNVGTVTSVNNVTPISGNVSLIPPIAYGTSTTAAATAEKVVSIPEITQLNSGQIIVVSPTKSATVADLTIKLNNFTAYPILYAGAAITTSTDNLVWNANQPSAFIFNGSNWLFLCHGLDSNTTYSTMSVEEGVTGTATSNRSLQAVNLKQIIQGTTLTDLSIATASTVLATDSITDGIGKLQAQINALPAIPTNISAFNNDSGYITSAALNGYATENFVTSQGYITGITSSDVTTALGYTPYNSTNPDGYITSSALSSYVDLSSAQDITGTKTFVGQKKVAFKQSGSSDKLGFTLYNNSGTENGYLEYNPSNTVDSVPLMTLGNYATAAAGLTHVGFRKYSSVSGASGAYNLLAPLVADAKTPFSLTTTYTNFYLPLGFTNGNTTVLTAKTGLVDISSLLPTIPTVGNGTITINQGGTQKGTFTVNQSGNTTIELDAGGGGGASALTDLSDVSITSASSGEALCYDGSDWINSPKTLVTIVDWTA